MEDKITLEFSSEEIKATIVALKDCITAFWKENQSGFKKDASKAHESIFRQLPKDFWKDRRETDLELVKNWINTIQEHSFCKRGFKGFESYNILRELQCFRIDKDMAANGHEFQVAVTEIIQEVLNQMDAEEKQLRETIDKLEAELVSVFDSGTLESVNPLLFGALVNKLRSLINRD